MKLKHIALSTRSNFITYGMVIVAYAVMEALLSGGLLTSSLKGMLVPICAYVVMAVSLNLTVGIMGREDTERQALNVYRMRLLGAEVVPVDAGTGTLKDAVSEAFREWTNRIADTHYCLGSVMGPHPFPTIVRDFQSVISKEIKAQMLEKEGRLPDAVLACVGGGSNAIGSFYHFINDPSVRLIGCEAAGRGVDTFETAATIATGRLGIFHGMSTVLSGVVYRLSGGATVFENIPDGFSALGTAKLGRVPLLSVLMAAFVLIFWFVMRHTPAGRKFYAIGGGEEAARIAGIRVKKYKILTFVLCAVMACVTGMLIASRVGSANTTAGDGYFLKSYAAVFIGCTASRRGVPNVLGTLLGAAILGVLANGLTMVFEWNVSSDRFWVSGNWELKFGYQPQSYLSKALEAGSHIYPMFCLQAFKSSLKGSSIVCAQFVEICRREVKKSAECEHPKSAAYAARPLAA